MNFKKIVTVIVAGLALCTMFSLPCEAATTTATTEENVKREYTESELRYMSSIIYCEARGESYAGQKAVGIVVMNRVRSNKFPNSVKKVIYQKGQFSPVRSGSMSKALAIYDKQNSKNKFKNEMVSCREAAIEVLEGSTTIEVNGKIKEMKNYLFFSRYVKNAKYVLGGHQFK
jgi:spore germination cell wall hydrolase CwlJ-like protein